jgi:hypothetical protein
MVPARSPMRGPFDELHCTRVTRPIIIIQVVPNVVTRCLASAPKARHHIRSSNVRYTRPSICDSNNVFLLFFHGIKVRRSRKVNTFPTIPNDTVRVLVDPSSDLPRQTGFSRFQRRPQRPPRPLPRRQRFGQPSQNPFSLPDRLLKRWRDLPCVAESCLTALLSLDPHELTSQAKAWHPRTH